MDKENRLSFKDYLLQNQQQTFIQNLIQKYQKQETNKSNFKISKRLTSVKEEVLSILEELPHQNNILQNLPPAYSNPEGASGEQLLKLEVKDLSLPFNLMEITERCEDLERLLKVVNMLLNFNVMKHSDEFVEGMTNIQGIQEDLAGVKEHSKENKEFLGHLKEKIVLNQIRAMQLNRKRQRLILVKKLVVMLLKKFNAFEAQVITNLNNNNFFQALKISKDGLNILESLQKEQNYNFHFLNLYEEKFNELILQIREKMIVNFGLLCLKFDQQMYDKVIEGHQFNVFYQKHANGQTHQQWLINHMKDKFRGQVVTQIKRVLAAYSKSDSLQVLNMQNPQIKMSSLCKMMDERLQINAIKDLFRVLSNLLYNHHLMTRFHQQKAYSEKAEDQSKQEFNQDMRDALVGDRKSFWDFIQDKVLNYFHQMENVLLSFNSHQLYDLLQLSNKFIEIGFEFSGDQNSDLLKYIVENLTQKYADDFKSNQMSNLKHLMEIETWHRLPLPDNFDIKTIVNPLFDFPKNLSQNLSLYIQYHQSQDQDQENEGSNVKSKSSGKQTNLFSNFAISNPFDKVVLLSLKQYQQSSPPPVRLTQYETGGSGTQIITPLIKQNLDFLPSEAKNHDSPIDSMEEEDDEDSMDIGEEESKVYTYSLQYTIQSIQEGGASKLLIAYQQDSNIDLKKNIVISSSGLNMVKSTINRYIELMNICRHMTFDLFLHLTQVCELFAFMTFHMIVQSQPFKRLFDEILSDMSPTLRTKLEDPSKYSELHEIYIFQSKYKNLRIHMQRIKDFAEMNLTSEGEGQGLQDFIKEQRSQLSYALYILFKIIPNAEWFQLSREYDEKELIYRSIIGVESVVFMNQVLLTIKDLVKQMLNTQQQSFMIQFYNYFDKVVNELREFIYIHNVQQMIELDKSIVNIQFINWNIKQKKQEVSTYVEKIISLNSNLQSQLTQITQEQGKQLPDYIKKLFSKFFFEQISIELLDSISKIKKVNIEGRQSLLFDIQELKRFQSKELGQKDQDENQQNCFDKVERYIKAYFMDRDELLSFIKENDLVYSYNMVKNLIMITPCVQSNIKNSDKKEFMQNVEIFYRDYYSNFMLSGTSHQF